MARPTDSSSLDELIRSVCAAHGLAPDDLGRRSRRAVAARAELAQRATTELGLASRAIARALGVSDSTVSRALGRS